MPGKKISPKFTMGIQGEFVAPLGSVAVTG